MADFCTGIQRERQVHTLEPNSCLSSASESSFGAQRVSGLVSELPGTGTSMVSLEKKSRNRSLSVHHFATLS
ncbi:MAG: hypothetical protein F4245_06390 [Cenarchaeum sp. SB0678_bin_8]|nr:hypothetical protein [Cenarchaeum sp. SB0662_bin_33]MYD59225.1 hypothetical protein [Cenarchaeum sp. SB0678_bin_8]